jgi:hypothetical protein
MAPLQQASPAQRRHAASLRRDGALNRLSSITAAIAVATAAAVGALGVYVAKTLPGHHPGASTGMTTSTLPVGNTGQGAGTSSSPNALNPPSTLPTAASAPAPVTSGST